MDTTVGVGDLVTDRGEGHVVGRIGMSGNPSQCVGGEVAVGTLVLEATVLGAVVDAVSEAEGALDDDTGCACGVCRNARVVRSPTGKAVTGRGRQGLDTAARVHGCEGSVANAGGWGMQPEELDQTLEVLGTLR